MEELTDNDIHISPLTIISNRYGGGFLAFNLESWDVPKEINDDGLDFISFWHHDAQKYIIGKGDTPQEAMDNLKAKLNPAPDNPLIDKFLFLDFEGIANLGDQDFRENLQFIVEQTHCKIIITSLCRLDGPETVHEKWKELQMPVEYYSMTPVMSGFLQDPNNHLAENIELSKRYKALEINTWLEANVMQDYRYAIVDLSSDFYIDQEHLIASIMSKVFRITPKRTKRVNGQVITPEMVITVTTRQHCLNPFYNGAVEIKEQYMRMYQFDYKKACMSVADFTYQALD